MTGLSLSTATPPWSRPAAYPAAGGLRRVAPDSVITAPTTLQVPWRQELESLQLASLGSRAGTRRRDLRRLLCTRAKQGTGPSSLLSTQEAGKRLVCAAVRGNQGSSSPDREDSIVRTASSSLVGDASGRLRCRCQRLGFRLPERVGYPVAESQEAGSGHC